MRPVQLCTSRQSWLIQKNRIKNLIRNSEVNHKLKTTSRVIRKLLLHLILYFVIVYIYIYIKFPLNVTSAQGIYNTKCTIHHWNYRNYLKEHPSLNEHPLKTGMGCSFGNLQCLQSCSSRQCVRMAKKEFSYTI